MSRGSSASPASGGKTKNTQKDEFFQNILSLERLKLGDSLKLDQMGEDTLKKIQEALIDLTTLTVTTVGADGKKIETKIKLSGDVESLCEPLSGDKLVEYHEKMAVVSVNIMKTYAQLLIEIVSVFVPWAGLKIPKESMENIQKLIEGINLNPNQNQS